MFVVLNASFCVFREQTYRPLGIQAVWRFGKHDYGLLSFFTKEKRDIYKVYILY